MKFLLQECSETPWLKHIHNAIAELRIATMRDPYPHTGRILSKFSRHRVSAAENYIPYVLHPLGDRQFIWLNRRYQPLGKLGLDITDYSKFPQACVSSTDPAVERFFAFKRTPVSAISLYLFNDYTAPKHKKANADAVLRTLCVIAGVTPDFWAEGENL